MLLCAAVCMLLYACPPAWHPQVKDDSCPNFSYYPVCENYTGALERCVCVHHGPITVVPSPLHERASTLHGPSVVSNALHSITVSPAPSVTYITHTFSPFPSRPCPP